MRHIDLFSGIGGFALATEMVWEDVEHVFCENDTFCQKVLKTHWPSARVYGDIKELDAKGLGTVDLLTGGFPCQPFSGAGKKQGKADDRWLWPEMFRIVQECRPTWVIGENVVGIIGLALDQVLADLETADYETRTFVIPACATGAPHKRERVWFVAYSGSVSEPPIVRHREGNRVPESGANSFNEDWTTVAADLCRMDDGVPIGVDKDTQKYTSRTNRFKSLGNAIVPQVALEIMRAMKL